MQVAKNSKVTIACRMTDEAGNVLDDGSNSTTFTFGRGELLAGLERRLEGKEAGWSESFTLEVEEAYGPHRPELVFEAVRDNLPEGMDIQPGMNLYPGGSEGKFQLRVLSLTENGAMLDGNHPLAGKRLSFEVRLIAVESAG